MKIEPFLRFLRKNDRATKTIRAYAEELKLFTEWFEQATGRKSGPGNVTPIDIREWKLHQEDRGLAPSTINRRLAALRAFFAWAQKKGLVVTDPTVGIRDKRRVSRSPRSLARSAVYALRRAAQERIQLSIAKCPKGALSPTAIEALRDQAILLLFLGAGLRLTEVCSIDVGDIELRPRGGAVTVRMGKGDKWRTVPLNVEVRKALRTWLDVRMKGRVNTVFLGRRGGSLHPRGVQRILDRLAAFANVPRKDVCPHLLRHTFAKSLVDAGEPLTKVQVLLGHDDIATTTRYTIPTENDLAAAVERISWSEGER